MIISHQHRYVFVELPRTGSTAIRLELRELYDGRPILHKHATYDEFLRQASPAEREYFSFAAIRNPLDDAVSRYFKLRTDHKNRYSHTGLKKSPRLVNRLIDDRMFQYIERHDPEFPEFLRRFYVFPYDTWASLSHRRLDFVMRFENLAADFEEALRRIGLEPKRPLPVVNATGARRRSFETYYTPDLRPRVRRVFGPYMEQWGYSFPPEWGLERPSTLHRAEYLAFSSLAKVYWRYVRPRV